MPRIRSQTIQPVKDSPAAKSWARVMAEVIILASDAERLVVILLRVEIVLTPLAMTEVFGLSIAHSHPGPGPGHPHVLKFALRVGRVVAVSDDDARHLLDWLCG